VTVVDVVVVLEVPVKMIINTVIQAPRRARLSADIMGANRPHGAIIKRVYFTNSVEISVDLLVVVVVAVVVVTVVDVVVVLEVPVKMIINTVIQAPRRARLSADIMKQQRRFCLQMYLS